MIAKTLQKKIFGMTVLEHIIVVIMVIVMAGILFPPCIRAREAHRQREENEKRMARLVGQIVNQQRKEGVTVHLGNGYYYLTPSSLSDLRANLGEADTNPIPAILFKQIDLPESLQFKMLELDRLSEQIKKRGVTNGFIVFAPSVRR